MIRDLDLSSKTEQFSFIRTINVDARNDNERQNKHSSVDEIDSRETLPQEVSALCTTSEEKGANSLTIDRNHPTTISDRWYDSDIFQPSNLSGVVVSPESPQKNDSNVLETKGFGGYLDRILLITAGGYVCFILWWLFASQNALFPIADFSQTKVISSADAEFIDYMKQSLEVIDRKVAIKEVPQSVVTTSKKETPEVVYVPIYTPTPKNTFSSSIDLSLPNNLLPPPPPNQLAAINPPVSNTTAIPIESPAPPSESVEVKTIPATTTSSNSSATKTSEMNAATIQPKIDLSLVGVMQLGEGSAALFKINGITQQILLGEKIENTNWVLDSIDNQKVKISDRDTTRIISVGENL